jgi:hypothetical protein
MLSRFRDTGACGHGGVVLHAHAPRRRPRSGAVSDAHGALALTCSSTTGASTSDGGQEEQRGLSSTPGPRLPGPPGPAGRALLGLGVRVELERARCGVAAAKAAITVAESALESARQRLRLADGRYQVGVGTALEVSDAQLGWPRDRAEEVLGEHAAAVAEGTGRTSAVCLIIGRSVNSWASSPGTSGPCRARSTDGHNSERGRTQTSWPRASCESYGNASAYFKSGTHERKERKIHILRTSGRPDDLRRTLPARTADAGSPAGSFCTSAQ